MLAHGAPPKNPLIAGGNAPHLTCRRSNRMTGRIPLPWLRNPTTWVKRKHAHRRHGYRFVAWLTRETAASDGADGCGRRQHGRYPPRVVGNGSPVFLAAIQTASRLQPTTPV